MTSEWSRRRWMAGAALLVGGLASGCASAGDRDGGSSGGADRMLYFLTRDGVNAVLPDGGAPVSIVSGTPNATGRGGVNDGIAIDLMNGHIYWTNMGRPEARDGAIYRCDVGGENVVTIVPPGLTHTPKQMQIDDVNKKLYWSDREGMAVMRCNFDGSRIETIVSTGNSRSAKGEEDLWCVGLALDVERRAVYWTQKGGSNAGRGLIRRTSMDMPSGARADTRRDIQTLFSRMAEPIDLALDTRRRVMYWTDRGENTISRAPMDVGGDYDPAKRMDRQIIATGFNEVIGLSLDLERGRLAYGSLGGNVGVADLDGANRRIVASNQGLVTGVAWLQ